jgi:hypothetical protein
MRVANPENQETIKATAKTKNVDLTFLTIDEAIRWFEKPKDPNKIAAKPPKVAKAALEPASEPPTKLAPLDKALEGHAVDEVFANLKNYYAKDRDAFLELIQKCAEYLGKTLADILEEPTAPAPDDTAAAVAAAKAG